MREIYSFKEIVKEMINPNKMKLWVNEKQGRRVECILKIGTEQFVESDILYENKNYVIRGQNISKELSEKILEKGEFNA